MSTGKTPSRPGAREGLIETHLPLVRAVARRYAGRGAELDDLVQAGSVGLVKASRRFDPTRGVTFAAFAAPTIEGEIRHHLRDRVAAVRIPRDLQALAARIARREPELAGSLGRAPSAAELAAALEVSVEQVQRARQLGRPGDPLGSDAGGPDPSPPGSDPADGDPADARLLLTEQLRVLDERERQVIYLRFHRDLTERQIAREVGISQAQVSRLLSRALDKLRAHADEDEPLDGGTPTPAAAATAPPPRGASGRGTHPAAYSGRFLVRMPSELHEALARAAQDQELSLNRYVVDALGEAVQGASAPAASPPGRRPGPAAGGIPEQAIEPRSRQARAAGLVLAANTIVLVLAAGLAVGLIALVLIQGV